MESEHHAVVSCDHAAPLREAMQKIWELPSEANLTFSGPEWLLLLIDRKKSEVAARLLLILWRAWFVRNEPTHGGRWIPMERSISFLSSYWDTLVNVKLGGLDDLKGKAPVQMSLPPTVRQAPAKCSWKAPEIGWIKINVDGAFS